jgi:hypothetical protein
VGAILGGDAVREFIDQIDAVRGSSAVDVLIHSTGGDGLAAWKIMSELRERFETVSVLVPFMAFSAATLFALGADEIVMHPHASLGPIDPQITIQLPDGSRRAFAFEDVGAFLRFLAKEVNLTEQAPVATIADKLFSVVDPVHIGAAKRASELAADVGERLLKMHMTSDGDQARARAIAESLNKNFFAHGDAVSRTRARKLDLKIAPNNTELERLMWEAYTGIESYMELRTPFIPVQHYLKNGGADALATKAPLRLPPNAPKPVIEAGWNRVLQIALQEMAEPAVEVEYSLVHAILESPRLASEARQTGILTGARVAGGEVQLSGVDTKSGWQRVPIPSP